jgi:hypothetical protein
MLTETILCETLRLKVLIGDIALKTEEKELYRVTLEQDGVRVSLDPHDLVINHNTYIVAADAVTLANLILKADSILNPDRDL